MFSRFSEVFSSLIHDCLLSTAETFAETSCLCKMVFLAFFVAIAILIVSWYQMKYYRRNQHLNKIPSMKRYPIIGSSWDYIGKSGEQIFKNLEKASKELGPIWRLDFSLFQTQIFLSDPKVLEGLLSSQKFLTKASEYDVLKAWLGDGGYKNPIKF